MDILWPYSTGSSPARIGFLRKIIESNPIGYLEPIDQYFVNNMLGKEGEYYLIYFGKDKPNKWDFILPKKGLAKGAKYKADIIDTWNMSIQPLDKIFEIIPMPGNNYKFIGKNNSSIKLPSKPYMALRIYKVSDGEKVIDNGKHDLE